MLVLLMEGNQIKAGQERIYLILALNLSKIVSLSLPQDVPMRPFKTWKRLDALAAISVSCGVRVKRGSNVTSRIFGFFLLETGTLFIVISCSAFTILAEGVNSVSEDFSGLCPYCSPWPSLMSGLKIRI